ncbi:HMG-box [Macrolepiota fuliginosa MF-IS2]|uniref:HMG-box n=1 Tax=Macrolepiota fuliginosa MF-IS2 TaxID=1400762 RepID=A0A9P5XBE4_9AGAR|nr:HMG-box [Macrolepiota fuliginosa MF-IS2]
MAENRELYIKSIIALSENMRKCAELGENFAKLLANASDDEMRALTNPNKRKATGAPDDEDGPKKRKRATKPKDPNAPKRPPSSYILFQNEIRKELKEKHPALTNPELLAMISDLWKKMSEDEKLQYHNAVESAKERYSQDKKAYDNRTPEEVAAANAATAEAAAAKKRSRKKKVVDIAPADVPARPPPVVAETSQSATSSDDESDAEESDDEEAHVEKESQVDSDVSEEEEEEEPEEKPAKRAKKGANVPHVQKTKKSTK